MLSPYNDRLDYGQILAPPEGFVLDFAIGTTYSLDLDALVGASIALGLSVDVDSDLVKNPICLLEALRTTGDKVALFCEGGQIHVPGKVNPLYILLEKMVFQVITQKSRSSKSYPSFHPKFWLLRFRDEKKNPLYRVVVLSRNLTFDRSWDLTFAMEGRVSNDKTTKNLPVEDFLGYLTDYLPSDENGKEKKKRIRNVIRELPYVKFELDSKEFDDFEFLPTGIKRKGGSLRSSKDKHFDPLFRNSAHETLVMSPFLTNSVIKDLIVKNRYLNRAHYMLFTRAESLEKLDPIDCVPFRFFVLKDLVAEGESAISEETETSNYGKTVGENDLSEQQQNFQNQDIHAKIFMVRKDSDVCLYLGSMNASHKAIYSNVEFTILLKTKSARLNMKLLASFLFNGDEDGKLNPFEEVKLGERKRSSDEEDEKLSILDGYVKLITRINPYAVVSENGEFYDITVNFERYDVSDYTVTVRPLLSKKTEPLSQNVQFKNLSLAQLSSFYVVAVSDGTRTVERVIIIPTEGIPEDREKTIVSNIVENEDCFYRYVAFLLGDSYVMGAFELSESGVAKNEVNSLKYDRLPPLYEKMLKTAATDPERLKEIDYLLSAVSADGVIPEEFENMYGVFKKVVTM